MDIFSYEVVTPGSVNVGLSPDSDMFESRMENQLQSSVVVYNFHSTLNHDRFFIFAVDSKFRFGGMHSISDLFFASNWLEREVSELHGISFFWKKDTRNLMLQYGDSSQPFQKSEPTIGFNELVFDPVKDTIINNPVSLQL